MKRVCVVITARPSYSRVKTVLKALQPRTDVDLRIVVAGSALLRRYGSVVDEINREFEVEAEVPSVVEGDLGRDAAVATGLLTAQLATLFSNMAPDVVVTIADRHETLATAIAASYQNIKLCHLQGGETSGSIDDKVRWAVSMLSDVHCVATEHAGAALHEYGVYGPGVHVTGCPGLDLAAEAKTAGPLPGKDYVVLQHPDTRDSLAPALQMQATIDALAPFADKVLWFWPGEDPGSDAMAKELRMLGVHPVRHLAPVEFLRTLLGSGVLVGNSSVGIRECSFLGVPVVNVGDRQQGRERGSNVIDVSYSFSAIRKAVRSWKGSAPPPTHLYGDGAAGKRIANILVGES